MLPLPSEENKTDEELVVDTIAGDKEAFSILVGRYIPKLLRYGRKFLSRSEDIEDIVQDVFLKSYANLLSFDTTRKFSPWIYRIAHNTFVNALRTRERLPITMAFDTLIPYATDIETPSDISEREDMKHAIEMGISKLSPTYREVLTLYYIEELDYETIADVLAVPIGTVGVRLARARAKLREILPGKEEFYD